MPLAVLLLALGLSAQPARNTLASVKTVKCSFTLRAAGNWNKGAAEIGLTPEKLSLQFIEVDSDGGTARMVGGFGNYDIIVRLAQGALHFIQAFRDGPLYTTTIFDEASRDSRLKAVHTRHEYADVSLPGFTSRPEQYYGDCEVGR